MRNDLKRSWELRVSTLRVTAIQLQVAMADDLLIMFDLRLQFEWTPIQPSLRQRCSSCFEKLSVQIVWCKNASAFSSLFGGALFLCIGAVWTICQAGAARRWLEGIIHSYGQHLPCYCPPCHSRPLSFIIRCFSCVVLCSLSTISHL